MRLCDAHMGTNKPSGVVGMSVVLSDLQRLTECDDGHIFWDSPLLLKKKPSEHFQENLNFAR